MHRVFRLKPHLYAATISGDQVVLVGERVQIVLGNGLYGQVAALLDGARTVRDLVSLLEGAATAHDVMYALMKLEAEGYVVERATAALPPEATFWGAAGLDEARLAETSVAVEGLHGEDAAAFQEALARAGVAVDGAAPFRIFVTDDYLTPELEEVNRRALDARSRWMIVKPSGLSAWLGPIFHPGKGPCWKCLAHRLQGRRPVHALAARGNAGGLLLPRIGIGASLGAARDLAALAVARWILGGDGDRLHDRLVEVDFVALCTSEHIVTRRPQCAACGDPGILERRSRQPIVLHSRPKRFVGDGGHRGARPEETVAKLQQHVDPLIGVVARLDTVDRGEGPLRHVPVAIYSVCPVGGTPSVDDLVGQGTGKGCTPAQTRASALCEAIERWSAVFQGDEPRIRACLADLSTDGVHPQELLNFSPEQYRRRDEINARPRDPRHAVPLPYQASQVIDWTPVWSMTGERRYLPLAYCYAHVPVSPNERICHFNPNGHAAGTSFEEAFLQAFLELVERDAVAIWWANRIRRPAVDLASFGDPDLPALIDPYRSLGWAVWVLDLTHDLEIPAFAAMARSTRDGRLFAGYGCHLDARLAASRALTELGQVFDPDPRARSGWDEKILGDAAFLLPDERLSPSRSDTFQCRWGGDLRDDVEICVERAARVGLETMALDQTRPDVNLSVVKVIVPGLRHFWPRFGQGRLYDVPVRLGWRARPLAELELNHVPIVP
jgi:ribosomal protein S12 methylthiotransferase accessory factor